MLESLKTTLLNLYDGVHSSWLTLDLQGQLAIFLALSGVLILLIALVKSFREYRVSANKNLAVNKEVLKAAGPVAEDGQSTGKSHDTPASTWTSGLARTRHSLLSKLQQAFSSRSSRDSFFEKLEELLITSDMGVATCKILLEKLREQESELTTFEDFSHALRTHIEAILSSTEEPEIVPMKRGGMPLVIAVVGVNGVGKTTTIGKLAWQFGAQGARVLIVAGDTFRAAAEQQLQVWAERANADLVGGGENAKPSTVVFEAIHRAQREQYDVVIIDTAGRLHTRVNLMNELRNVMQLIHREQPGAPHETLLVLDATTGQNALQQAIDFNKCAPLTGVVITKLDGTPKGGIIVAIKQELGVPIRYVGIGEQITDLKLFSAEEFTAALFSTSDDTNPEMAQGGVAPDRASAFGHEEDSSAVTSGRRVIRRAKNSH